MAEARKLLKLYEKLDKINNFAELVIKIDGSALVNGTLGSGGVLIGRDAVTAKDDGSNTVTLSFKDALPNAPEPRFQMKTANCRVDTWTATTTGLVYSTVQAADGSTAVADADLTIWLTIPISGDLY